MLSEQAKTSFDAIFKQSLTKNLSGQCTIETITDTVNLSENEFVLLTIVAPVFKFLTLFYINTDESVKSFFLSEVDSEKRDVNDVNNDQFRDSYLEFVNVFCGVMNQYLLKYFNYLGTSTPYILKRECATALSLLNPGYLRHFKVTVNDSIIFHITLSVFDFADLDFKASFDEIEHTSGELELF